MEREERVQILKNAYSRPLPFQWIPKFNLCARTAMTDWRWKKLSKALREWKLEDDILDKIKDKYGITCCPKNNIQF